jgi:hypothetical protein
VIIVFLEGRLERQKEIVDRFDFRCVDVMALNDEIRLSKKMIQFYLPDDLLKSGNAELFFFKEFFHKPKRFSDDALSLLQKLMADFVLVKCTQLTA